MNEKFVAPSAPKDLFFNEQEFVQKVFDSDIFLQEHRKNVSLEKMRDDLGVYLKILRSAMIELINKDYADFVNLSSNLIGLDKAINNLEIPVGQLREEVMQVRQCLEDAILEMSTNLENHKRIREKRQSLHSLIKFRKCIKNLNNILISYNNSEVNLRPDIIERAATEFNQLNFHICRCKNEISQENMNELEKSEQHLNKILQELFILSLKENNLSALIRCLRIYISLNKISDAENIVKTKIVIPAIENIVSEYSLQNDSLGLKGIYKKLENILDTLLLNLLDLTLKQDRVEIKGFNFLVNSFWQEIEQRIEDYLPVIFAPGNPDLFHKRYLETLNFLACIEKKYPVDNINTLKNDPQYQRFLKKWNLPVYFQLRFQEIAGVAESILSANVSALSIRNNKVNMNSEEFSLHATCILWDCIMRAWDKDVYLPQLLHRFWKLYLQLCSRYQVWCQNALQQTWAVTSVNETNQVNDNENIKRLEFLVDLYTDIEKLSKKTFNFIEILKNKEIIILSDVTNLLNESTKETSKDLEKILPFVTQEIVNELLRYSTMHLKEISDIPRLFRRTNRDVPTKPCAYVQKFLDFLLNFHKDYDNIIPETLNKWLTLALTSFTEQYTLSVQEVLTSVQKTEESLRRLKKIRDKSTGISTTEKLGTSDDEKIRIQLYIDVLNYIKTIKEFNIKNEDIPNLQNLLDLVETAVKK